METRHRHHNRRERGVGMNMAGIKRQRQTDSVALETSTDITHDVDQTSKRKITYSYLPDFMQKDPLALTKQRWIDKTNPPDIEEEEDTAESERKKGEMMVMTAASLVLSVVVVYALASSTPDMVAPNNLKESENVAMEMLKGGGGNAERLEFATRNIVGTVLPQNAEEVIAASIGEGIAGVIGALATWLVGLVLNFKPEEQWQISGTESTRSFMESGKLQLSGQQQKDVDTLVSGAVADGDYFLTRAAAQPLLEAIGIPIFVASIVSVLVATVPYQAVKLISQKRRLEMEEEELMDILLEEEEKRKRTVMDKVSNNMFGFFQSLNVRRAEDNFFEDDFEIEEELDTVELPPAPVPAFDYVELFADLTKWLEYDVLITNYRGVLALPNGQLLTIGWESAIFGFLAALSSQLYTDVLYLYSDFGNPLRREQTINRSLEGWASVYAAKCVSTATLFGVYAAVRNPISRAVSELVSGGAGGCRGSKDFELCLEVYLQDNPPAATLQAEFRALAVSAMNFSDNLLPLNDQESFGNFARGELVTLYSVLSRFFDI